MRGHWGSQQLRACGTEAMKVATKPSCACRASRPNQLTEQFAVMLVSSMQSNREQRAAARLLGGAV
eukprot:2453469-Alexandrium_andersonii.AAC.1